MENNIVLYIHIYIYYIVKDEIRAKRDGEINV